MEKKYFVHSTAEVSRKAHIGSGAKIWNNAQICDGATVGNNVIIGKNVYIGRDVRVGHNEKIQNNCSLFRGVVLEDNVFVGPHVCFTNDKVPRATGETEELKRPEDWIIDKTLVKKGASIGAGSVILPDLVIGRYSLVGAGSIVTKDVPDHALVVGHPARQAGFVCFCGKRLVAKRNSWFCDECRKYVEFSGGMG